MPQAQSGAVRNAGAEPNRDGRGDTYTDGHRDCGSDGHGHRDSGSDADWHGDYIVTEVSRRGAH
jgi:hypothetical protein